jgi:uncharacterized protein (TIGR02246 family)
MIHPRSLHRFRRLTRERGKEVDEMPARTPEECDALFGVSINKGDLEGLVALYEPNASMVRQDGTSASGIAAIREGLAEFVAMKPKVTMNVTKVVRAGDDLAVLYNDWSLTAKGQDGSPVAMSGKAMEIVRRQRDGTWLFAVDDPFARG